MLLQLVKATLRLRCGPETADLQELKVLGDGSTALRSTQSNYLSGQQLLSSPAPSRLPRQLHRPPVDVNSVAATRVLAAVALTAAAYGAAHCTRPPPPLLVVTSCTARTAPAGLFTFFCASRVQLCVVPYVLFFLFLPLHPWCGGLPLLVVPLNAL